MNPNPIYIPIAVGIYGGFRCLRSFVRNWERWLCVPPRPTEHMAGPDDQDIDFEAALRSLAKESR